VTKRDALRLVQQENTLLSLGFTRQEAEQLRRISMTLHAWHERECGNGYGCIERDEKTGKPFWTSVSGPERHSWPVADREKGALKRLAAIMAERDKRVAGNRLPAPLVLTTYIQTDPRGAALYILRPGDVPEGQSAESYYTRGICIY
jgi:hypothetical protein